ncbi:MAG: hypothetical protein ACKVS5_01410 [Parvularculaceae bacterium]
MVLRIAMIALIGLSACAKKEEAPAADAALAAAAIAETAPVVESAPIIEETVATETENSMAACPVLDSRSWAAWTTPDGDGHTLHIEGEIDMPTPGYALTWSQGPADRAMPPGLRLKLDAAAPGGVVMQVVTPTPVSYDMAQASPDYRTVIVVCGGEAIAEIAPVGPKDE